MAFLCGQSTASLMIGTLVNTGTVLAGAGLGLLIGHRLPERYISIVFKVLGLFTLFVGISMSLQTRQPLVVLFALLAGGLLGEFLRLEQRLEAGGNWLKRKAGSSDARFTEGLVTAFMLFCVGAMTIIGTFDEGLRGDRQTIYTKSLMDFFSSMALASAFGRGVMFAAVPLFLYQGSLTLGAGAAGEFIRPEAIAELSATGGIMLIALGLVILEIKKIPVVNLLPALPLAIVLSWLADQI
jgi:uncharacterized protein